MSTAKQTVQLFWRHASQHPWYLVGLLVGVPLAVILQQFIPPLLIADALQRLSTHAYAPDQLLDTFGWQLVIYALLILFSGMVVWRVVIILIWKLEAMVTRSIDRQVYDYLLQHSAHFHANRFGGALISQAIKLSGSYIRFADTTLFEIYTFVVSFVATVVILLPRSPLFVLILTVISAGYLVLMYFVTRRLRAVNEAETVALNHQNGYLADTVTNVMAVKSFAAEDFERSHFAKATTDTQHATFRLMRASTNRDVLAGGIINMIEIAAFAIAIGGVVLLRADVTTAFLLLSYTSNIARRLWEFNSHVLRQYNKAFGDSAEMVRVLNTPVDIQDPSRPEKSRISRGEIAFDNVTFTHADAGDALFKKLQLTIKPGEKIGLVGHSGSGKTTLTKLLLRFADVDAGAVKIDGQNIAAIRQADLRRAIAYVPQEPLLFHRTIRDNIAYGLPRASKKRIIEAAKAANAHDFIQTLPQKYETLVGERGVKLSGGQRQRVAIARAMIKDAPILVLDEATSALDSESEKLIQSALWRLMEGRTTIVIAHRLSTIQKMDRIIVLDNGKILEQGTHNELLRQSSGTYAKLWTHQSGGFLED